MPPWFQLRPPPPSECCGATDRRPCTAINQASRSATRPTVRRLPACIIQSEDVVLFVLVLPPFWSTLLYHYTSTVSRNAPTGATRWCQCIDGLRGSLIRV